MPDYFALLNEPRRPWLDPDSLKTNFLSRSSACHPDHNHNAEEDDQAAATRDFTELNTAYRCLREPKDRLLHLLELERGVKPGALQNVPSELLELFVPVGRLCREADAFLTEKNKTASPLLKVQMFERAQEWTEKLNSLQHDLNTRREELTSELKSLDAAWDSPQDSKPLDRLEKLYRYFSFIARWTQQIQERVVQLSF